MMMICIVHDSELGNGERLANSIRERLNADGHTAVVGHERTLTPKQVIESRPDLIILGSAVRKFSLSPVTKRWIDELAAALTSRPAGLEIPRAAIFITHALKTETTDRKGTRLRTRLARVLGEERVYPGWISARVAGPEGPFHEGVEEAMMERIDAAVAWASGAGSPRDRPR